MPKEVGLKGAVYVDAGSPVGLQGPTGWPVTGETISNNIGDSNQVRSSVGAGIIWQSPFGPLRVDVAVPLSKCVLRSHADLPLRRRHNLLISSAAG